MSQQIIQVCISMAFMSRTLTGTVQALYVILVVFLIVFDILAHRISPIGIFRQARGSVATLFAIRGHIDQKVEVFRTCFQ